MARGGGGHPFSHFLQKKVNWAPKVHKPSENHSDEITEPLVEILFFVGKIWLSLATIPIEFGATDEFEAPKNDPECSI